MHNTHYFILYTSSPILYLEQQQKYAMRCTTVAPIEAGSHVGCQRQLPGTVEAADRDCAADGEHVADCAADSYLIKWKKEDIKEMNEIPIGNTIKTVVW